jgi:23S rRNA (cytosine1962-C5)-methyltransferase
VGHPADIPAISAVKSTMPSPTHASVTVSRRGATRLASGHSWVYRSDVADSSLPPGVVEVLDERGRTLGRALWSPASEIRLRLLTSGAATIDRAWWSDRIAAAAARRAGVVGQTDAYRVVHAEGDGLPSLVVDRYGAFIVAQLLSAGLESVREDVLGAVLDVLRPEGILLRNDASVRKHEGLPLTVEEAAGSVPDVVRVCESGVRFEVNPRTGQKTGAFLDQRENRVLMGEVARGRALDVFTYQGLFALHMAGRAESVVAVDSSAPALAAARHNAALNTITNVEWREANGFDLLRELDARGERFETIVLDPPAFAKRRDALPRAVAGYKEINLRAMRLLAPGGRLLTCSCSFHLSRARFLAMLGDAAADSGRRIALERVVGQAADHPQLLTVPETEYLKGALLRALE